MGKKIILASGSAIRHDMLRQAGLDFDVEKARIDEEAVKQALLADEAKPYDISDALAELKALRVSNRHPDATVVGSDQVLEFGGTPVSKAPTLDDLRHQLTELRGKTHRLHSAAVIAEAGAIKWRHVGTARLTMRSFSDTYLDAYLDRNGEDLLTSVGGYKFEQEGIRLFSRIEGDYFDILGMPLLPLLNHLTITGVLDQ